MSELGDLKREADVINTELSRNEAAIIADLEGMSVAFFIHLKDGGLCAWDIPVFFGT